MRAVFDQVLWLQIEMRMVSIRRAATESLSMLLSHLTLANRNPSLKLFASFYVIKLVVRLKPVGLKALHR